MKKIDAKIEPLVREALAAAITQDPERLRLAITAFPDAAALTDGLRLAAAVAIYALHERLGDGRPAQEDLAEIAGYVVEDESWTDVTADEIVKYLDAVYDRVQVDRVLPMERVILVSFVVAASLISTHRRDDEEWWDHLDRVEAAIEATPEP